MKKIWSFILCGVICAISLFQTFASADTNNPDDTEEDRHSYHNIFNQVFIFDDMPTLKIEAYYDDYEDLSDAIKKEYVQLMEVIPIDIRQVLKQDNIVVMATRSCREYWPVSNPPSILQGFYVADTSSIYITLGDDEYITNALDRVLYHEIGHAVDYLYGNLSNTREFKTAHSKDYEANKILNSDRSEAFADTFLNYMLGRYNLKDGGINYQARATALQEYPHSLEYMMNRLNLETFYEGYAWPVVRLIRWRTAQRFYNSQTIERITGIMVNNLCETFIAEQAIGIEP